MISSSNFSTPIIFDKNSYVMSDGTQHLRVGFTVIHLCLVAVGFVNLLIILLIVCRPYLRSITNVYMLGLCLADFIYLTDLIFVAATSLNGKSWPFGETLCSVYHGTETTAKYASVLFITLLAADRYFAICKSDVARGYRSYKTAVILSICAWIIAVVFSAPLYFYGEQRSFRYKPKGQSEDTEHLLCMVNWLDPSVSTWYVAVCSVVLFIIPGCIVAWCYYQVFCKLREHIKGSRRLHRSSSTRYQKVTQMVQRVVLFHLFCWSPFWLFNLFSTLYKMRITTLVERILINIVHLFPYINCAVNPILYAHGAENFRTAFREIVLCAKRERNIECTRSTATKSTCYRNSSNVGAPDRALSVDKRSSTFRPPESFSVYVAEDDSPLENDNGTGRLPSYTGNVLEVRYNEHKCSARSILVPAVTVSLDQEGTPL